jgi:hypothetical protein
VSVSRHFPVALATVEPFTIADTIACSIVADATGTTFTPIPRVYGL